MPRVRLSPARRASPRPARDDLQHVAKRHQLSDIHTTAAVRVSLPSHDVIIPALSTVTASTSGRLPGRVRTKPAIILVSGKHVSRERL